MAYGTESHRGGRRHRRPRQPVRGRGQAPGLRRGRGGLGLRRALRGRGDRRRRRPPPSCAAIDLVVQAEHGPDGLAWLVTWSEAVAEAVIGRGGPHRRRLAAPGRPRGHPGRRRVRGAGRRTRAGRGRGQRGGPRAPRAPHRTTPTRSLAAGAHRRGGLPRARCRRPAWATTWPDPTTCCPPTGRPGSPARSGSTTSVKHIHVVSVDARRRSSALAPHVVTLAETEGLPAHAESVRLRWPRSRAAASRSRTCPRCDRIWSR